MDKNRRVLIRVDASAQVGTGHLMRMLALSQLLSDAGYRVHIATIPHNPQILDCFKSENFRLEYLESDVPWDSLGDIKRFLRIASRIQPSLVVLDGIHFDSDYERRIKEKGFRFLRINDVSSNHCYADILLNQNYGAEELNYSTEPDTQILAGLKYVLLRKEFRDVDSSVKKIERDNFLHLLVSLGGMSREIDNVNSRIIQGLSSIDKKCLSVTVIVGKTAGMDCHFEKMIENISCSIEIKHRSQNMVDEMAKADLAIVSGGSTMWELMYMRVPFLAISVTKAQRNYLPLLSEKGLCVDLGWHEDLTSNLVRESVIDLMQDNSRMEQIKRNVERVMDRDHIGQELLGVLDESS